jgi:hypothetical protein
MSDGVDKTDELYPIAVLIDELKVHGQITVSLREGPRSTTPAYSI